VVCSLPSVFLDIVTWFILGPFLFGLLLPFVYPPPPILWVGVGQAPSPAQAYSELNLFGFEETALLQIPVVVCALASKGSLFLQMTFFPIEGGFS